jgi:leucine dehydrogenase
MNQVMTTIDLYNKINQVNIYTDSQSNLIAIVALDGNGNKPGLGGCRFWPYASFDAALEDAISLAKMMTLKTMVSNVPFEGGKVVIIKPNQTFNRDELFKSFGKFINNLGGRFITGCDIGVSEEDMKIAATETTYLTGFRMSQNRDDLSYFTALGVRRAIEACVKSALSRNELGGLNVVIQGLGKVGYYVAKELSMLGANLYIYDIDPKRVQYCLEEFQATPLASAEEACSTACDIFVPCGMGNIINPQTINNIRAKIICGAANNQLSDDTMYEELYKRNIFYVPDFIANVGGTIYAAGFYNKLPIDDIQNQVYSRIYGLAYGICEYNKSRKLSGTQSIIDNLNSIEERMPSLENTFYKESQQLSSVLAT